MSKPKKSSNKRQRNNYQDKFAKREFTKGEDYAQSRDKLAQDNENSYDRYYSKNRSGEMQRGSNKSKVGFSNDWSWYVKDNQQLKDFASLSYNVTVGRPLYGLTDNWYDNHYQAVPGIMALYLMPTVGVSIDRYSAVNVAADQINQFLRSKVSGTREYDSANIMMYIMAMDSLYSYYAYLKRIYGVMNNYEMENEYLPRNLIEAMGVNYDDVKARMSEFRGYINQFANTLSTWAVPNTMSIITKHVWMYSNVYKDSDTSHAQLYLYSPAGFYIYDETPLTLDPPLPAQLKATPIKWFSAPGATLATVDDLIDTGELMYKQFSAAQWNQLKGDILSAYGGNLFTVSNISETEIVIPVYNQEVLSQINNTQVYSTDIALMPTLKWNITEIIPESVNSEPYIYYRPIIDNVADANYILDGTILNMHHNNPSPEENIVATRNMVNVSRESNTWFVDSCGSEICVRGMISFNREVRQSGKAPVTNAFSSFTTHQVFVSDDNVTYYSDTIKNLARMTCFDWHPLVYMYMLENSSLNLMHVLGDIDTYCIISRRDIENLNDLSMRSLFGIPMHI